MSTRKEFPRHVHVDPRMLQRMANAYLSRTEIAHVLKLTEGTLARRLKRHSVITRGDEVKREREWMRKGRLMMRALRRGELGVDQPRAHLERPQDETRIH